MFGFAMILDRMPRGFHSQSEVAVVPAFIPYRRSDSVRWTGLPSFFAMPEHLSVLTVAREPSGILHQRRLEEIWRATPDERGIRFETFASFNSSSRQVAVSPTRQGSLLLRKYDTIAR